MPMTIQKITEWELNLLIFTDGKTESQRWKINCPRLVWDSSTAGNSRIQISLYNSAYSRNVLYLPSQLELGVKKSSTLFFVHFMWASTGQTFKKTIYHAFCRILVEQRKKVLNSFVWTSFYPREQILITFSSRTNVVFHSSPFLNYLLAFW